VRGLLRQYALEHAQGEKEQLFLRWQCVRRDLRAACAKLGIPGCSPNDLRRTCATWLRAAGTPPHLIAPLMGHADKQDGGAGLRAAGARCARETHRESDWEHFSKCSADRERFGGLGGQIGRSPQRVFE
jgi:integrase